MDLGQLVRLPLAPVGLLAQMAHDLHELRCNLEPLPDVLDRLDARVAALDPLLREVAHDVRLARLNVEPMDEDLAEVTQEIRAIGPKMQEVSDQVARLRDDLGGLPFVGR